MLDSLTPVEEAEQDNAVLEGASTPQQSTESSSTVVLKAVFVTFAILFLAIGLFICLVTVFAAISAY